MVPACRVSGPRRPRSDECGQASVEHAAAAALVLVVLAVAVAVAARGSGEGIANAVHSGVRRALCVAGGDPCADFHVRRPCTVALDEEGTSRGLAIGFWRIGKDHAVTVERRSDGTVGVTEYDDVEGGVGTSAGLRFGIGRVGTAARGLGIEATVGIEGRLRGGWGRSWEVPDAGAARELVRRLAGGEDVRAPDVDRVRVGVTAVGSGEVAGRMGAKASGSVLGGLAGEGTRDRRTGETTVSLALPAAVTGDLAGPLGLRLGGALQLEPSATLATDRGLRPRELRLVGRLATCDGTRRRDVQVRVDLTRPEAVRGFGDLVDGLVGRDTERARVGAVALGRWAADEGWIDEREYRTAGGREGLDLELGLGVHLGLRDQETARTERLVAARTSPPGGLREDRTDCVGAR